MRERRDWDKIDPVQYFNKRYAGKIITREQLRKVDGGLYHQLYRVGKLDELLPNSHQKDRDWSKIDPVQYFNEKYKGKIITKKQLEEVDGGLYSKLRKIGKLDEVFPLVDQRSQLENLLQDYVGDV